MGRVRLYRVQASRDGAGWALLLPGIGSFHTDQLRDVEPAVQDVVATVLGVEPAEIIVRVELASTAGFAPTSVAARRRG